MANATPPRTLPARERTSALQSGPSPVRPPALRAGVRLFSGSISHRFHAPICARRVSLATRGRGGTSEIPVERAGRLPRPCLQSAVLTSGPATIVPFPLGQPAPELLPHPSVGLEWAVAWRSPGRRDSLPLLVLKAVRGVAGFPCRRGAGDHRSCPVAPGGADRLPLLPARHGVRGWLRHGLSHSADCVGDACSCPGAARLRRRPSSSLGALRPLLVY